MLTRSEYETLVRDLLVEVNHLWVHEADELLRALPAFERLTAEYLPDLRDPDQDGVQTLRTALAYVDEVMAADWARVIEGGYAAYVARRDGAAKGSAQSAERALQQTSALMERGYAASYDGQSQPDCWR